MTNVVFRKGPINKQPEDNQELVKAIDDGHEVAVEMRRRLTDARLGEMRWDGGVVRESVGDR